MHDFDRPEKRMNFVLQATTHIIEGANKHGLKIMTLGELLDCK